MITVNDIVTMAKEKIGTPYKKLDCSAFARWVFDQFGVLFPRTAAAQAKYLNGKGLTYTDKILLQIGDTVYWRNYVAGIGRWNFIHHTAIYIGNGQIIESRGKGVQISKIWSTSSWPIVMYGHPFALIKQPVTPPAPAPTPTPTPEPIPIPENPKYQYAGATYTRLRTKASGITGKKIAEVHKGDVVEYLGAYKGWWNVKFGTLTGWVYNIRLFKKV